MKTAIQVMLRAVEAVVLASVIAPLALGQQGRQGDRTRDHDLRGSDVDLRLLERGNNMPAAPPEERLAMAQIKEDFLRIQMVNNKLMQSVVRGDALDLAFVAKSTAEIKKRAERLKVNLVLPEPEKSSKRPKTEVGSEIEQLRSSLSALGELIAGFVENPIFKKATVIDVQLSAKARRDLEEIIELSGQVKKSSEKLNKIAQKSQ